MQRTSDGPAIASSCRGVRSNSTACAGGRSRERAGPVIASRSGSRVPGRARRALRQSAASRLGARPVDGVRGDGQDEAERRRGPRIQRQKRMRGVAGEQRPRRVPLNARATDDTERSPTRPNRAISQGWRGTRIGRRISLNSASCRRTNGPSSRCHAGPSSPSDASVVSSVRQQRRTRPSSSGCASGSGAATQVRP